MLRFLSRESKVDEELRENRADSYTLVDTSSTETIDSLLAQNLYSPVILPKNSNRYSSRKIYKIWFEYQSGYVNIILDSFSTGVLILSNS